MRVLLINPETGDYGRASTVVKEYMDKFWFKPRPRHLCVIYGHYETDRPVAVWHSRNQITLHFGDPE